MITFHLLMVGKYIRIQKKTTLMPANFSYIKKALPSKQESPEIYIDFNISSMRSIGNGGHAIGCIAIEISFNGLSSGAA